jgi:TPR repeat protein
MAADQGDVEAQLSLGGFYESGKGVAQDYCESARYYRMAANINDHKLLLCDNRIFRHV